MVHLGIIGTGGMAHNHASAFRDIRGAKIIACCDSDSGRAKSFAEQYGISKVYTDYHDLLANTTIDAISIATPDSLHAPMSIAAVGKGKHVLCEKPLATSSIEAQKMVSAARLAGVINMINFSYRDTPAIQKAAKIIQAEQLGAVRHVQASYLQGWLTGNHWGEWRTSPQWLWRLSKQHGSLGVLGDIGVHILDFASFPVGPVKKVSCLLKTLQKEPGNRIGPYCLDANDTAVITAEFCNGAIGSISTTRWATGRVNELKLSIYCDSGALDLDLDRSTKTLMMYKGNDVQRSHWKEVSCPRTPSNYQRFVKSIRTGNNDQPDFARGAEIQDVLEACIRSSTTNTSVRV